MNTFAETIKFSDNGNPDYCYALLHLAYFKNKDKYYLIWGMAELIPGELKEDSFWKLAEGFNCFKNQNAEYYFLRKVINKQEVIDIYNSIKNNKSIIIRVESILEIIYLQSFIDSNQNLNIYEEPFPENLFLTVKDNSEFYMPFVANHWGAVRIKGFINTDISFIKQYIDDSKVLDEFKTYLQWNLNEYAELLGSFWFVLPNPLFREISTRMLPPEKDNQDKIQVIVQPRNNKKLDSLTLKCFERRDFGYISFNEAKFDKYGIASIPISCDCEAISLNICCSERGLIYYEPFEYFIKSFNISLDVVKAKLKQQIITKDSNEIYESEIVEKASNIVVDNPNKEVRIIEFGKNVKFHHNKKNQIKNASEMGQKLFIRDNIRSAENYIRDLINKAKNQVVIIDPYFASPEFIKYSLSISSSSVKVTVLTSQLHLNKFNKKMNPVKSNKDILKEFINSKPFQELKNKAGLNENFKVLATKEIVIHDRFLIIDKDVYFSGNSLNKIGKKMSMIIKLPFPDEVIKEIEPYLNSNNPDVEKIV